MSSLGKWVNFVVYELDLNRAVKKRCIFKDRWVAWEAPKHNLSEKRKVQNHSHIIVIPNIKYTQAKTQNKKTRCHKWFWSLRSGKRAWFLFLPLYLALLCIFKFSTINKLFLEAGRKSSTWFCYNSQGFLSCVRAYVCVCNFYYILKEEKTARRASCSVD